MTSKEIKAAAFEWLGKDAEEMKKGLGWTEFASWPNIDGGVDYIFLTPVMEPEGYGTLAYFDTDNSGKIIKVAYGGPGEFGEVSV